MPETATFLRREQVQVAGLSHDDLNKMSKMLFPQDQPKKDFAELSFWTADKSRVLPIPPSGRARRKVRSS